MEPGIFSYILKHSRKAQIFLVIQTAIGLPFLYFSYDVPKTIINKAIGGKVFPRDFFGIELEQIPYLFALCFLFIALVFINGGFKYYNNVFRGIIAERVLRRLRYELLERVTRFPLLHFRNVSQGEVVSMVTKETEPLGGFIGDSLALPAFQGGTLLTIVGFMFIQNPVLGLAAISLYPVQAWLIPKLQNQVNLLNKERVQHVRQLSNRVGELVTGINEVHAHDTSHYELADFSNRLGIIYDLRFNIYKKKFFIKFLNNFLAALTPFLFYSLGGYLVITGSLTLGALVAVLAAYKDLSAPWKELLKYYQRLEDTRIRYSQIVEEFQPAGMFEQNLLAPRKEAPEPLSGELLAANVSLEEDEGTKVVDGATFSFDSNNHVAIVGPSGSGKTELTELIARLGAPTAGKITIGDMDLSTLPEATTGRLIGYVGQETFLRSGTIRDNLLYVLKHYPLAENKGNGEDTAAREARLKESQESGNSEFDFFDDWIDYAAAGTAESSELMDRLTSTLAAVDLEDDIFKIGLRRVVNPDDYAGLSKGLLDARRTVREKLKDPELAGLVEEFDPDTFNTNASVAENILFGTPADDTFALENLGENQYLAEVLERVGLTGAFLDMGRSMATLMVELFRDLPPGHEFFDRFSFIDCDDLPEFQRILNNIAKDGIDSIGDDERKLLMDLPFKLVVARHHLDIVDKGMQNKILEARAEFARSLPEDLQGAITFFDPDSVSKTQNIRDNILFGKLVYSKPESASRIGALIGDIINDMGLREIIVDVGLDYDVGIGGKRLSGDQRQKLAIARCLLKQPQIMIVNEATAALDSASQIRVFEGVKKAMKDRGLVWVDSEPTHADQFAQVLNVEHGRVKSDGAAGAPRAAAGSEAAAAAGEEAGGDGTGLGKETELLAGIPFFAGMDRSKLKLLAFTSERQDFDPGTILFWQGTSGSKAYVIVSGTTEVTVDTPEGPKEVANPTKGDLIGELALLCDAPRTATIRAKDKVSVLNISKDVFLKLVEENPEISVNLTRIVAKRLEETMRSFSGSAALFDESTGLPTKELFKSRLRHILATGSEASLISTAIVTVNLGGQSDLGSLEPGMKSKLLKQIVQRFSHSLRETDTLAHLDDDFAFGIIAVGRKGEVDTDMLTERLTRAISEPITVESREFQLHEGLKFDVYSLDEQGINNVG